MIANSEANIAKGEPKQIPVPELKFNNREYIAAFDQLKKDHAHDHNPENDARQIFHHTVLINRALAA